MSLARRHLFDENWLTENDTLNADCECVGADIQFGTVVDIVVASPIHELLEAAVLAADLAGALSESDSLTVFAPTDDAITALVTARTSRQKICWRCPTWRTF